MCVPYSLPMSLLFNSQYMQLGIECAGSFMLCATFIHRLMETAKEMIRESLPIKCLEAAILGLYP